MALFPERPVARRHERSRAAPKAARAAAVVAIAALFATAPTSRADPADTRVALVVAEESYAHYAPSADGAARGARLSAALDALGFETETLVGARDATARAALRRFVDRARSADLAVVALIGHIVGADGASYLLPSNVEITRATDLFSRGIAVPGIAAIVGAARDGGAVLVIATRADLPATLPGVSARPQHDAEPRERVGIAYSSSPKTPVSQVDQAAATAMSAFDEIVGRETVTLDDLLAAVASGPTALRVGEVGDIALRAPAPPPAPIPEPTAEPLRAAPPEPAHETARETPPAPTPSGLGAGAPLGAPPGAEPEGAEPDLALGIAPSSEAAPVSPASPASDPAGPADAAGAPAAIGAAGAASAAAPESAPGEPEPADLLKSLALVEGMLSDAHRRQIQKELRARGHYDGGIDAVFGPRTRAAITAFQVALGAPPTGYLTPQQMELLFVR